jgi:hypothetical protein
VRAFDDRDRPAIGSIDQDEIQRDRAAFVVERRRDAGLVVLLAQDGDRDAAELSGRAGRSKDQPIRCRTGVDVLTSDPGERNPS